MYIDASPLLLVTHLLFADVICSSHATIYFILGIIITLKRIQKLKRIQSL